MITLTKKAIKLLIKPRDPFSHKGDHGHALIMAGSEGQMGASVIAASACLRAGVGLLTVCVPQDERCIIQTSVPEATLLMREEKSYNLAAYSALGIGPGIRVNKNSEKLLVRFLTEFKSPVVLDADALNMIALYKDLLTKIPKGTILTPHPKEFDRLFGIHKNENERIKTAIKKAKQYNFIIVLKGHTTLITYAGEAFLNTTGNAGLAKGGSGDALTGIITGFVAQGYEPEAAAKAGVFIHGLAADIALKKQSMESMLITDVINCLGKAFKSILN